MPSSSSATTDASCSDSIGGSSGQHTIRTSGYFFHALAQETARQRWQRVESSHRTMKIRQFRIDFIASRHDMTKNLLTFARKHQKNERHIISSAVAPPASPTLTSRQRPNYKSRSETEQVASLGWKGWRITHPKNGEGMREVTDGACLPSTMQRVKSPTSIGRFMASRRRMLEIVP
jgi:hypothetical protein